MDDWDEIRTAYQVARFGTVSGAAEALGVHHATVIRHIDALEGRLGAKLFQRHARGYTATEAGQDLLRVAQVADDQFNQMITRIQSHKEELAGELVITSLQGMTELLLPVLMAFQAEHPDIILRHLSGERLFRLEYGEAHIAIRAGSIPEDPDHVIQPLAQHPMALVAAESYIARYGLPASEADFAGHRFVGHDAEDYRAPYSRWLATVVPRKQVVYRTLDLQEMYAAVIAGAGIGFVPRWLLGVNPELREVVPLRDDWISPLWVVTHVDLHRSAKVQGFLRMLKGAARDWTC
ncbi:LysR family transcriptional regulator [Ketogulonicigenium vulgare]|uniref:Transcriptional regulator, LysR family, putative n=1 Tax=Ketogulonicigenium vulgare (strain WSH-001) TaxID=759362 RepID=F9Y7H5_KETVW|nr:LysR family transcriptional regulator [Ketogulonicigenium vulgare]ADO41281.1 transcriptional regulator, LysR family, putative [Ketogulonicigenium vulgare Y25]AEM42271.1 Transcriptional regulator, LysR family, putative [Ketogulonicigenium vulgare WSH-001]ALJ79891.1 LysR family transcriptional regulator [Ketogulonicigenium vulgare]ANW32793.1 LysR family transcriptional regulator [Ketogulonicigenium vulgare]AOZ53107.1 LysR family transcriptional regulator [Ketogulonicigenium vulgare]